MRRRAATHLLSAVDVIARWIFEPTRRTWVPRISLVTVQETPGRVSGHDRAVRSVFCGVCSLQAERQKSPSGQPKSATKKRASGERWRTARHADRDEDLVPRAPRSRALAHSTHQNVRRIE